MKKIVLALCLALSVFACSSMVSEAAICSGSPDGLHHYDDHRRANAGYSEDAGTHRHHTGYDSNNQKVYETCYLTDWYEYCERQCHYCQAIQPNSRHTHFVKTQHSVE